MKQSIFFKVLHRRDIPSDEFIIFVQKDQTAVTVVISLGDLWPKDC